MHLIRLEQTQQQIEESIAINGRRMTQVVCGGGGGEDGVPVGSPTNVQDKHMKHDREDV